MIRFLHGDARHLDIPDDSVDLIVTSPPYFGLRSYRDGGEHMAGQVGAEATPGEFVTALVDCTREWVRVLKPSGSMFVNLGDKYGPTKSLRGLPWRYALACVDDLGLILRAELIWSKPNGLPESVTDRVRRAHETWFHFTTSPTYYAGVDAVRDAYAPGTAERYAQGYKSNARTDAGQQSTPSIPLGVEINTNPLGKLPGSVRTIATEPLRVPAELGVDHYAAFPTAWPIFLIKGWSPPGICVECGQGRRAVTDVVKVDAGSAKGRPTEGHVTGTGQSDGRTGARLARLSTITGYVCGCPHPGRTNRPAVVLDPFGGTGTTALVADVLGRDAIHNDLSADYNRIAKWRTTDAKQRAKVATRAGLDVPKPPRMRAAPKPKTEPALFDLGGGNT